MSLWVRMLEHDGSMLLVAEKARGRREERRRETESQIDIFSRERAPRDYSKGVSTNYYHLLGNSSNGLLSGCWRQGVAPTVTTFYHKDLCKDSVLFLSVFSFLLQLQQLFLLRLASASVSEDERERKREKESSNGSYI